MVIIPLTQNPNSMRLTMLSLNLSVSHCPLNVTSGMAWTMKSIDSLIPATINAIILLYKFLSSSTPTYSPDWYYEDFCKYISSIIKIQSQKGILLHELFLTLLTHQHHLVEFYWTMAKTALKIFQVITCSLGVTDNVNVRHTKSLAVSIVVSHAAYKNLFD